MAYSTEELRETSRQLVATSIELRRAAEVARKQGVRLREVAQEARAHGEACRNYADAARRRQNAELIEIGPGSAFPLVTRASACERLASTEVVEI